MGVSRIWRKNLGAEKIPIRAGLRELIRVIEFPDVAHERYSCNIGLI